MKTIFFITSLLLFSIFLNAQTFKRNLSLENWQFSQVGKNEFLSAKIPGNIYKDLLLNNKISDPFYSDNEKQLQWIENENWVYRTQFQISKKELDYSNIELVFEGIDTYSKVFLNGKEILNADNMFRVWKKEVKKNLKIGKNSLEIIFTSAVKQGKLEAKKLSYTLPEKERVFVRKAQYQFGWDFAPRFVGVGIWKPVNLEFWNDAKIELVKHTQNITNQSAKINFLVQINAQKSGTYFLKINDFGKIYSLKSGINTIFVPHEIKNPKLWWSNGLGEPHLYHFDISLAKNQEYIDSKSIKIGLRTVEVIQEKDNMGSSFYFKLNGIPVYMKGANIVPPNAFPSEITKSDYEQLVKEAKFANMNMLRVWGGGIYPDNNFYNACDENGILVWQDFMFACSMYPGDSNFLNSVKNEVIDQVNNLQNHPSLAIWCGNNENDEGWHNWGWQKQLNYSKQDSTKIWNDYIKLFRKIIPKILDSVSAQKTIYWQSSPKNGWGRKLAYEEGDVHYWGVWWGLEPFEKYEEKVGRFVSEYGFQGLPNIETLQSVAKVMSFDDTGIKNHQKHAVGFETITKNMELYYKVPSKFEDFAYVSQLLQARGMKTAIEAHRRAKPYNMGTLFWQLNDPWPVISWSAIDFYGSRKAFWYQAKKSFQDILISFQKENNEYKIWLNNDIPKDIIGTLDLKLLSFEGKEIWKQSRTITLEKNSSKVYEKIVTSSFKNDDLVKCFLMATFSPLASTDNISAHFFFIAPKNLGLTKPKIRVKKIDDKTIELTSDVLAKDVYLNNKNGNLSDNYFDLLPNEKKYITSENPIEIKEIKTLFDAL